MRGKSKLLVGIVAAVAAVPLLGACGGGGAGGGGGGGALVIYSGAEPNVLEPLVARFEKATGINVQVRPGDSPRLALQIDAEGKKSPAGVFLSQSPGAMGFLATRGRLRALPAATLARVPARFRADDGRWVAIAGRVRAVVYNTNVVKASELPKSVFAMTAPQWKGRVGVAPNNGSFIDFVSGLRVLVGDARTAQFLKALRDNGARTYPNNLAIVAAVARGEIDAGLVNHYYNEQAKQEDPTQPTQNYIFPDADPGALILTTTVGVLDTAGRNADAAQRFVAFLLQDDVQRALTRQTFEYPMVAGVPSPVADLPPLAQIASPTIDLSQLGASFQTTRTMIADSGLASS